MFGAQRPTDLTTFPAWPLARRREGLWQTSYRAAVVVMAAAGEVLLAEISPLTRRGIAAHLAESRQAIPDGVMRERRCGPPGLDKAHGFKPSTALAPSSTRRMNTTEPPARPSRDSEVDKVPCTID